MSYGRPLEREAMPVMKIEFIADGNPIYVLPFFEEFLRNFAEEFHIQQISICREMGKRSRLRLFKEMLALYGYLGLCRIAARMVLAKLLGTLPSKRTAKRFHTISQLCRAYGIPFTTTDNPNGEASVGALQHRGPDLLVSVACPHILKKAVLQIPRYGCVNIHHAPLPEYKGMMPTFWQMFHGNRKVGLTIHYMAEKVDEGDSLLQSELPIAPNESLDSLIKRAKRHAAHCLVKVLRQIEGKTQVTKSLSASKGTYFTFPTIEQIREFRQKGLRAL